MKKVRFETYIESLPPFPKMEERECHSPRPFTEKQIYTSCPDIYNYPKVLQYSTDPVQLFENSNSSPYPLTNKTNLKNQESHSQCSPCNDLELSMLDALMHEPRKPASILKPSVFSNINRETNITGTINQMKQHCNTMAPPNILLKDDFFLRRQNLVKANFDVNPVHQKFNRMSIDKENNPHAAKLQVIQQSAVHQLEINQQEETSLSNQTNRDCMCHHCIKNIKTHVVNRHNPQIFDQHSRKFSCTTQNNYTQNTPRHMNCICGVPPPVPTRCSCCEHNAHPRCTFSTCSLEQSTKTPMNAVDKKNWAINKYEQSKSTDSMEVEKQTNITKEKREPTVADLFKIIKLQNEQLQLLQEKVDKFISNSQQMHTIPVQNCISEQVAIEGHSDQHHKISIGVMTSFEMVRTSTIINKEAVKTKEISQIQAAQSQISIKDVVSNFHSPNLNFLDGIAPVDKGIPPEQHDIDTLNANEEKTLNELSLYNVQVENAITPLMSPEQSLYLDIQDYSGSEAESNDQSNVGWTYYNKVMTHVNGMLQDSDMPSSASALYRNTRHQMQVQMQIDKTNVSVTKRVKFGDDPLGLHRPHIYSGTTDTSLKMNQLAAKYLKSAAPVPAPSRQTQRPTTAPIDMSFATRNYMEKHKLLQGIPASSKSPLQNEMPRFLDITALKQQPKLL